MNCQVCLNENTQLFKNENCQCSFCYDCVLNQIEEKIKVKQDQEFIPCLNHKCKENINLEYFLNSLKGKQQQQHSFCEIMFNNYLQKTNDIRPCSNKKCNYYAFLPKNRCSSEFQCELCGQSWLDKEFLSLQSLFFLKIRDFITDARSLLAEFLLTQNCPKCESIILKNGGCSHMTCKKCSFYYCWICNHDLQDHPDILCGFRIISYFMLLISCFFITIYRLNWFRYLFYLIYPCVGVFLLIYMNLFILLPITIIYTIVNGIRKYYKCPAYWNQFQIKKQTQQSVISFLIQMIVLIIAFITGYYDIFHITMQQFFNFHYYQTIIILTCGGITASILIFNKCIYKNWLQYLL